MYADINAIYYNFVDKKLFTLWEKNISEPS